ncbi:hypothetical protein FGB62_28g02 [Gracilaria domingensis]|nr:hypothetical protein FGB62_28g02 [Gracilaria domingensis]
MLRLLNCISREEQFADDTSASEHCSDTHHLAQSASATEDLNDVAQRSHTSAEDGLPAASSLPSSKHADHMHSITSNINHNQPLTDSIINQASQVTISNPDQTEHTNRSSKASSSSSSSFSLGVHVDEREHLSTHPPSPHPHRNNHSELQQLPPPASQLRNSSRSHVVEHIISPQSLHASANRIDRSLSTSAKARLHHAVDDINSFAHFDVEQLTAASAQRCSFEQLQNALRDLAQVMVWADQHQPSLWDSFLELSTMPLLVTCLRKTQQLQMYQRERLANGREQHGDSENAMIGNTKIMSENVNASGPIQTEPEKDQFVHENKTEDKNGPATSPGDGEQLDEGHTQVMESDEQQRNKQANGITEHRDDCGVYIHCEDDNDPTGSRPAATVL